MGPTRRRRRVARCVRSPAVTNDRPQFLSNRAAAFGCRAFGVRLSLGVIARVAACALRTARARLLRHGAAATAGAARSDARVAGTRMQILFVHDVSPKGLMLKHERNLQGARRALLNATAILRGGERLARRGARPATLTKSAATARSRSTDLHCSREGDGANRLGHRMRRWLDPAEAARHRAEQPGRRGQLER